MVRFVLENAQAFCDYHHSVYKPVVLLLMRLHRLQDGCPDLTYKLVFTKTYKILFITEHSNFKQDNNCNKMFMGSCL